MNDFMMETSPEIVPNIRKFAVIGSGSFGTAIACIIARAGNETLIYGIETEVIDDINNNNLNSKYFGDLMLPNNITASNNIEDILDAEVIVIAVPSNSVDLVIDQLSEMKINKNKILLIATKGLSSDPVNLISTKIEHRLLNKYAFISGPNFAKEIVEDKLTSIVISSEDQYIIDIVSLKLKSENVILSEHNDIVTIQVAGIVKNIVAIKSGIMKAQGVGKNGHAWLISQGLKEIVQISAILDGVPRGLYSPAVIGDLVLTCSFEDSRNMKFGYELHKNNYSKDFIKNYDILVEGLESIRKLSELIDIKESEELYNYSFPIINSILELTSDKEH